MKLKKTLATILVLLLFFHQFIIVLADNASDEITTTATQDDVAPTIVDLTNNTGYSSDYHVFKANVTDNENGSGVSVVNLEYWYDNENDSTVASMNTANNVTYNISLTLSSNKTKIYYKIHAYDVLNNHNMVEGNVTIYNNVKHRCLPICCWYKRISQYQLHCYRQLECGLSDSYNC